MRFLTCAALAVLVSIPVRAQNSPPAPAQPSLADLLEQDQSTHEILIQAYARLASNNAQTSADDASFHRTIDNASSQNYSNHQLDENQDLMHHHYQDLQADKGNVANIVSLISQATDNLKALDATLGPLTNSYGHDMVRLASMPDWAKSLAGKYVFRDDSQDADANSGQLVITHAVRKGAEVLMAQGYINYTKQEGSVTTFHTADIKGIAIDRQSKQAYLIGEFEYDHSDSDSVADTEIDTKYFMMNLHIYHDSDGTIEFNSEGMPCHHKGEQQRLSFRGHQITGDFPDSP